MSTEENGNIDLIISRKSKVSFAFSLVSLVGLYEFSHPFIGSIAPIKLYSYFRGFFMVLMLASIPAISLAVFDIWKKGERNRRLSIVALVIGILPILYVIYIFVVFFIIGLLSGGFSHLEL